MEKKHQQQDHDLLLGAKAIASYLGVTPRQVYWLAGEHLAPSFKIGTRVAARRSSLTAWLDDREKRVTPEEGERSGSRKPPSLDH